MKCEYTIVPIAMFEILELGNLCLSRSFDPFVWNAIENMCDPCSNIHEEYEDDDVTPPFRAIGDPSTMEAIRNKIRRIIL